MRRCLISALGKQSPCLESADSREGGKEILREDKAALYVQKRSGEEEYEQRTKNKNAIKDHQLGHARPVMIP